MQQPTTIIDILWSRGLREPDRPAYFFRHSRTGTESLTYGRLAAAVRRRARWLREAAPGHERAVLVYPPGLDFVITLFSCMAARIVPIPVYPLMGARPDRSLARIRHVASDADCRLLLTTSGSLTDLVSHLDETFPIVSCLAADQQSDDGGAPQPELPSTAQEDLALLQYTSGSTALPRGVKISHRNLLANSAAIHDCYGLNSETCVVSWLPPYHDMGLIGGIVQPLFGGFPVTLMSPHSFLQNPARWLEAISETRATTSPSPNFGYDLCVRKVRPDTIAGLDLSHWTTAICGAERVSHATLEQFARAFEPAGFRMNAFCPSYGLAEATLLVTASAGGAPVVRAFDGDALERGRVEPCPAEAPAARLLVGNGTAPSGIDVRIVDQNSLEVCSSGCVGEVWTSGAAIAGGYWNKPSLNETNFEARIAGREDRFLRTGDTGFFHEGQLFIAGRIKDLIILSGKNHFPDDVELAVRQSDPVFEGMPGATFSVDLDGQEILVVAQELTRNALKTESDVEELFRRIHSALFRDNVRADAIVLLRTGTIPRTSSGKVQRHQCRNDFLQNSLQVSAEWLSPRAHRAKAAMTRQSSKGR